MGSSAETEASPPPSNPLCSPKQNSAKVNPLANEAASQVGRQEEEEWSKAAQFVKDATQVSEERNREENNKLRMVGQTKLEPEANVKGYPNYLDIVGWLWLPNLISEGKHFDW